MSTLSDIAQTRVDEDSLATWGKDWTNGFDVAPSAIVFPESNEQVVELVRYAIEEKVKLVPSGGRTGLSGGASLTFSSIT